MGYEFEAHVPHKVPWFAWLVENIGRPGDKYSVLNDGEHAVVKFETKEDRSQFIAKWSIEGAGAISPGSARG